MSAIKQNSSQKISSLIRADNFYASLLLLVIIPLYAAFFIYIALPALNGETTLRIGADSETYITTSRFLASTGRLNVNNLVSTEFNFFGPIVLLIITNYNYSLIALINLCILSYSVFIVNKYYDFNRFWFILFLFINPITLLSIVSLNKEIIGLCGIILALAYIKSGNLKYLAAAIILSIMTRWQQAIFVMLLLPYIKLAQHNAQFRKWGPFITLAGASLVLPFLHPYLSFTGDERAENVRTQFSQAGGLLPFLNTLQASGFYWVAFIPKLLLNYVGNFPRVFNLFDPSYQTDFYNKMLIGHQISMLIVVLGIFLKNNIRSKSPEFTLVFIYTTLYCTSLFISYRYFYPIYPVLLLLLLQRTKISYRAVI